jgi:hypothetical protein
LTLRTQRRGADYQNRNDQQPVHMARAHEQALLRESNSGGGSRLPRVFVLRPISYALHPEFGDRFEPKLGPEGATVHNAKPMYRPIAGTRAHFHNLAVHLRTAQN